VVSTTELDLKEVLAQQSANPLLKHVHADPALNELCSKLGQGISELLDIIKAEDIAPATVSRLQMVVVDGGALLAACVAAPSAAAIPASVASSIDVWTGWVDQLCNEIAVRKDERGIT
jgi:hypothetical protein